MKFLVLLLLSFSAFGFECANKISRNQLTFAKANNGLGSSFPKCKIGEECICFDKAREWTALKEQDVFGDDPSKPIIEKYNEEKCTEPKPPKEGEEKLPSCKEILQAKKCDKIRELFIEKDFSAAHCERITGYEQMFIMKEVFPDEAKEQAIKDAVKTKDDDKKSKDLNVKNAVKYLKGLKAADWASPTFAKLVPILQKMIEAMPEIE